MIIILQITNNNLYLPKELAPNTIEYQFNCNKIRQPTPNCPPKNTHASKFDISPLTNGLFLVRSTLESISLSHISFIVHPAPRIMNAPIPNKLNIYRSGSEPGAAHNAILHAHGQNKSHDPNGNKIETTKNVNMY